MTINGEKLDIEELSSKDIAGLLLFYKLNSERVAIEINGTVIKKDSYSHQSLDDNDEIEIIHFVGGGR